MKVHTCVENTLRTNVQRNIVKITYKLISFNYEKKNTKLISFNYDIKN